MRYVLTGLAGAALGCLLMLLLNQPWLRPFEPNTAAVVSALASTALAVIGAFALWDYQVRAKQKQLGRIFVQMFEPLYIQLCQVRDLADPKSARKLLQAVLDELPNPPDEPPSAGDVAHYQEQALPNAVEAAISEAKIVLQHWNTVQDILIHIQPDAVPRVLMLHRTASRAIDILPVVLKKSEPVYIEQIGRHLKPEDALLLNWAIGKIANTLNQLDGQRRDVTGMKAMEKARQAVIQHWSKGLDD